MSQVRAGMSGRARRFFGQDLWHREAGVAGPVFRLLQFVVMIGEGFVRDRLLLRASALTYFTALALIPVLAVGVSLVQFLGIRENLLDLILRQVTAGSPEARQYILPLVEGVKLGGLGTLGAVAVFVTTVLAISNVEAAFNDIWGVQRSRGWTRRFSDYLTMLMVAPLLVAVALALPSALHSQWLVQRLLQLPTFEALYSTGLRYWPMAFTILAFAFLYSFLPNTRVRALSALLGGAVAGVLFSVARVLYLDFQVGVARYSALFGGFAFLPLLFIWIYVCWALILLGAEVAFAHQNLALYRREVRAERAGPAEREEIGVRIAIEVARAFRDGTPAWTAEQLSDGLEVPIRTVREVLGQLESTGVVSSLAGEEREPRYQLGRPAERIAVADVLAAVRGRRDPAARGDEVRGAASDLLAEIERSAFEGPAARTLAEVLECVRPSR